MRSRPAHALTALALGLLALVRVQVAAAQSGGRLALRVTDAATGQPLPARVALRAADGTYPGDRIALSADRWPNIEAHGVFTRGTETFDLPPGATSVTVAHGPEYRAESRTVQVEAGKTAELSVSLTRVVDLRKAGWVAGDLHVHMLHGENERKTSYEDVALTCEAGGLDFASVGQEYVGAGELDLAGYHAACERVSNSNFRMLLGGERPKSLLGHQAILGVKNPFLIAEDPPYFRSARKVHAAGGALVYVHPVRYFPQKQYQGEWLDFPGVNLGRELLYDAYCGPSFDGLSVLSDEPAHPNAWGLWFNLLNRGFRTPIFADSDACIDRTHLGLKTPGFWTTYFYIGPGQAPDRKNLVEAVRRGRTFATTGPLLQFRIDDRLSGDTLPPDGKPHTVRIQAWHAQHNFSLATTEKDGKPVGISRVELLRNGQVVKTWEPASPTAALSHTVTETEPCWYAARVYGTDARWQIGAASPIYFAAADPQRQARTSLVRGRIYDFRTGQPRQGTVEVVRDEAVLNSFPAQGQFQVRMPLDAEIVVRAPGERPLRKNLLLDYGPLHRFLWYLESADLGKPATFDRFEELVGTVDLEFPLGYRQPGSYVAADLPAAGAFQDIRVTEGPEPRTDGRVAVAAVLMDTEQISPGDTTHVAVLFRDEGGAAKVGPLVVEARGYNPARPTAYGALKKFAEFEKTWTTAADLGGGYRLVSGSLKVADWVQPGPTGGIDLSIRARQGDGDAAYVGLHVPLGPVRRALSLSTGWPTMPLSWPDGRYGLPPFRVNNRAGRARAPRADYRQLRLSGKVGDHAFELAPPRDARGCPDADDAVYTGHFLDQVLSEQSSFGKPDPIRPQPEIRWDPSLPIIEAVPSALPVSKR